MEIPLRISSNNDKRPFQYNTFAQPKKKNKTKKKNIIVKWNRLQAKV